MLLFTVQAHRRGILSPAARANGSGLKGVERLPAVPALPFGSYWWRCPAAWAGKSFPALYFFIT